MAAMMSVDSSRTPPRHRGLRAAVLADARCTAAFRGERHEFGSSLDAALQILRLIAVSDAFLAQTLYRAKAALLARRVPVLPRLLHRLSIHLAGIYIGERAHVHPGIYIVHGQVVIAGPAVIHPGVVISPAVTIAGDGDGRAPTIGRSVSLGSGSRVLGAVRIGARARIGANAVVLGDVPEGATAVGIPARIEGGASGDWAARGC
jgi:serine O-acetyltransferase